MRTRVRKQLTGAGVCVAAALLWTTPAMGATITPNTFGDENGGGGSCSLREAIQAANTNAGFGGCAAGSGADTIPLATGTYQLAIAPDGTPNDNLDGDLDIIAGSAVTISHTGATPSAISGGGIDRVLHILAGGSAAISGVTIRDGNATGGAGLGGGIFIEGAGARLDLSSSTLTNNTAAVFGGAIENSGGTANLTNVTLSGNRAAVDSGGLDTFVAGAVSTLNNVTVTNNIADADANNSGTGGGIFNIAPATTNLKNTIVAGNRDDSPVTKAPDCDGPITSQGNNLIGDLTNCEYAAAGGDKLNVNPLLGPLADNGGSTFTHALLTGSPALNGAGAGAAPTDQRGVPRSSDIGAYELVSCGKVVVNRVGTAGADSLTGTAGADGFLSLAGADTASGLGGADALCGGDNKDKLKGGAGKDLLRGEGGKDKLKGGGGKDKLVGGPGKDTLIGGKGKDVCKGGGGKDTLKKC
jgi:CSLREA domain-containing protein